jgi:hypothetical protein
MLHVSRLFARRAASATFDRCARPRLEVLEDRLPPGDLWSLRAALFPVDELPTLTADPGDPRDEAQAAIQDQADARAATHLAGLPDDPGGQVAAQTDNPAVPTLPEQEPVQVSDDPLAALWSQSSLRDSSAPAALAQQTAQNLVRTASAGAAAAGALAPPPAGTLSGGAVGGAGLPAGSSGGMNAGGITLSSSGTISGQSVTIRQVHPFAGNDTIGNGVAYIARQVTGAWVQPVYNVAADAGVQTNDRPIFVGDLLQSVPLGTTAAIPWTSVSTITTAQGGTVQLHPDGGFSYVPPRTPIIPDTPDTFQYIDLEMGASGGTASVTSNPATVEIYRVEANPTDLLPGNPAPTLEGLGGWAKFHATVTNTGIDADGREGINPSVLSTAAFPVPVEGSPVAGRTGGSNAIFIENDRNLASINASSGRINWISTVETGRVHSAPLVLRSFLGDQIVVGVENSGPQQPDLVTLSAETGAQIGSFTAQETYTYTNGSSFSNVQGPTASSPTLYIPVIDSNGAPFLVFGTDGSQGYGQSGGRLYGIAADGTVVWETLLAGTIHGSPLVAPASSADPNGAIYVGTSPNDWGGRPEAPGGNQGRFYKLDPLTGAVLAEVFLQGSIEGSAVFAPSHIPGDPDPNGANASVVVTSTLGKVLDASQVVTAASGGKETPGLAEHWLFSGGLNPTSPALDPSGSKVYIGEAGGLRALPLADPNAPGAWLLGSDASGNSIGGIEGSPAVTTDSATGLPEIIFGTTSAGGGVYGFRDNGSGATQVWGLTGNRSYGFSSPAVTPFGRQGGGSTVFIGATDGTVLIIG